MSKRIGVYPGTFDPITLGHLDIIRRVARLVDHLIVGVAADTGKQPLFSVADRVAMVKRDIGLVDNVTVQSFSGLLVDFAQQTGASAIFRGLRSMDDFESEYQMAAMNNCLRPNIETVFLASSPSVSFIASSRVREIALLDGDIRPFVAAATANDLKNFVKTRPNGPI